jgi:hypothetical protein
MMSSQVIGLSGTFIHANLYGSSTTGYKFNVEINVPSLYKVEGLCGTSDGDNNNELKYRNQNEFEPSANWKPYTWIPDGVTESWR